MQSNKAPSPVPATGAQFRCVMPVRWGDLDALNHVNNTVYFRFVEEARVQMLESMGAFGSRKVGVLAQTSCDFLKPVLYPASVQVILTLARLGRTSLQMDFVIEREDEPGVAYAKGSYVVVGCDPETGRGTPWTPEELAMMSKVLAA
ncbi:acyl-CoA thioesterase [Alcaligenaceae bacterium]|nr:acyl-CoA thioesterase [Alcaligenaceae bacterium]